MTNTRQPIPQSVRFSVFRRDNFACRYCGTCSGDGVTLHIDHAVSVKDGGTNVESNLVTACSDCNYGKGAKSIKKPPSPPIDNPDGLIGMWGHTYDKGELNWQFKILHPSSSADYVCQLYSWMDGDATDCKVISRETLLSDCKLFATNELMLRAAEKYWERKSYQRDREREAEERDRRLMPVPKLPDPSWMVKEGEFG